MPSIAIHPPSHAAPHAATKRRHNPTSNSLPPLLHTPLGLALLEIQGTLNIPAHSASAPISPADARLARSGGAEQGARLAASDGAETAAGEDALAGSGEVDASPARDETSPTRKRRHGQAFAAHVPALNGDQREVQEGAPGAIGEDALLDKDHSAAQHQIQDASQSLPDAQEQQSNGTDPNSAPLEPPSDQLHAPSTPAHKAQNGTTRERLTATPASTNARYKANETEIGRLVFPLLATASVGDAAAEGPWMKRAYLYIGHSQRLAGEVKKLPRPIAILARRSREARDGDASIESGTRGERDDGVEEELDQGDGQGEQLEIVEIVRWKLFFGGRPEFV